MSLTAVSQDISQYFRAQLPSTIVVTALQAAAIERGFWDFIDEIKHFFNSVVRAIVPVVLSIAGALTDLLRGFCKSQQDGSLLHCAAAIVASLLSIVADCLSGQVNLCLSGIARDSANRVTIVAGGAPQGFGAGGFGASYGAFGGGVGGGFGGGGFKRDLNSLNQTAIPQNLTLLSYTYKYHIDHENSQVVKVSGDDASTKSAKVANADHLPANDFLHERIIDNTNGLVHFGGFDESLYNKTVESGVIEKIYLTIPLDGANDHVIGKITTDPKVHEEFETALHELTHSTLITTHCICIKDSNNSHNIAQLSINHPQIISQACLNKKCNE